MTVVAPQWFRKILNFLAVSVFLLVLGFSGWALLHTNSYLVKVVIAIGLGVFACFVQWVWLLWCSLLNHIYDPYGKRGAVDPRIPINDKDSAS